MSKRLDYIDILKGFSILCITFLHFEAGVLPLGLLLLAIVVEKWHIMRFFTYWGRNSLVLMVTHYSIVMVLCQIFDKYVMGGSEFVGWRTIVYFVATVLLTYPIVWFFNNKARFMLGRR